MPKAVFFSMGGGLGHLNRSLAVVRHLRRSAPHTEPLVLTNSPFCHLALSAGVPVLRLPGGFEQELIAQPDLSALVSRVVLETLAPHDVLVVDAFPSQIAPSLMRVIRGGRFLKVLVLRDAAEEIGAEALDPFDLIFYPFPEHAAPRDVPQRAVACGYIVGRAAHDVLDREQARLRLGLAPDGEEPVILAFHACSPAETMALFRQVKGASEQLGLPHALRLSTPQVLPGVEYFYPHLVSLYPITEVMGAADLVVCAGGYNAFAEVAMLGRRAIFRPLDRPKDRQSERVAGYPTFEASTPEQALAALMRRVMSEPPPASRFQSGDFRGAEVIAEAIARALALA